MHLSWLDPHKMRKITVVGRRRWLSSTTWSWSARLTVYEKAPSSPPTPTASGVRGPGTSGVPKIPNDEPLRLECQYFLGLVEGDGDRDRVAADGLAVVRALEQLQASLEAVLA